MAYLPTQLLNSASECRDRIQTDAGTVAAFFIAVHVGYIHAGDLAGKTRRTRSGFRAEANSVYSRKDG